MTETKREEHDRLQERTDELKQEHADLALHKTPYNQADHDRHNDKLQRHRDDLAAHKRRDEDKPE
jgi:hypothetical protein